MNAKDQAAPDADQNSHCDLPNLLTPRQAAEFLGLSEKTLANARVAGTSPPYARVFGRIRYVSTDLVAYVLAHRRNSTSEELRHG